MTRRVYYGETVYEVGLGEGSCYGDLIDKVRKDFGLDVDFERFVIWDNGAVCDPGQNLGASSEISILDRGKYENLILKTDLFIGYSMKERKLTDGMNEILTTMNSAREMMISMNSEKLISEILGVIPVEELQSDIPDENLAVITRWFKEKFFTFIRQSPCHYCQNKTETCGATPPTSYELQGKCTYTEIHACRSCGACTRFPRYEDVSRLLQTRCGRCSEFANAFVAILRAIGFDARIVFDWTDHVWAEVWLDSKQRYVHVDPCENIIDAPFTYESGWGKKLTWVMAFGLNEVYDVTPRYTQHLEEVLRRRSQNVEEYWVARVIFIRNKQWQNSLSLNEKDEIKRKNLIDQKSMIIYREEIKPEERIPRKSGFE